MRRLAALVLGCAIALAGCASEPEEAVPGFTASELPPNDLGELKEIFESQLAPLGLVLTRGALIDRSEEEYTPSDRGTHLALYVEPTDRYSKARYVQGLVTVTGIFAPEVFDRWPALESFDVCQEPLPGVDDAESPPPVTAVEMTRTQARAFDWDDLDLPSLLAASLRRPPQMRIVADASIAATPAYKRALQAALDLPGVGGDS